MKLKLNFITLALFIIQALRAATLFLAPVLWKKEIAFFFPQMAPIRMAWPDGDFNEAGYLKVFELADNYTINGTIFIAECWPQSTIDTF